MNQLLASMDAAEFTEWHERAVMQHDIRELVKQGVDVEVAAKLVYSAKD